MDVPASTSDAPRLRTSVNWLRAMLLAVVIAATLTVLARLSELPDVFRAPDAWTYDWRTAHFSPRAAKPHDDIVVVLIDDESLDGYASRSPVDRSLQARLVTGLEAAGAKAVGLDFIYDLPGEPEADKALFGALRAAKISFVLGVLDERSPRFFEKHSAHQERVLADVRKDGAHLYFAHKQGRLTVGDQVVRYWLGPSQNPPHRKGLAHAIAEAAGKKSKHSVLDAQLIDWQRPPELGDFAYPVRTLRVRAHTPGGPISDLFWPGWEDLVRGKIVLVGGDFVDRDRHLTPFSVVDGASMPSVMVHAQILAQILDGREVVTVPAWAEAGLLTLMALLGIWAGARFWLRSGGFLAWFGGAFAVFALGVAAFWAIGVIIPSATLFIAWLAGIWGGHPPGLVRRSLGLLRRHFTARME